MLVATVFLSGSSTWWWAWVCKASQLRVKALHVYYRCMLLLWTTCCSLVQCPESPSSTKSALEKLLQGSFSFKFILENFSYTENPETGPPLSKLNEEYASLKWVLHNNDAWDPAAGYPSNYFLNACKRNDSQEIWTSFQGNHQKHRWILS